METRGARCSRTRSGIVHRGSAWRRLLSMDWILHREIGVDVCSILRAWQVMLTWIQPSSYCVIGLVAAPVLVCKCQCVNKCEVCQKVNNLSSSSTCRRVHLNYRARLPLSPNLSLSVPLTRFGHCKQTNESLMAAIVFAKCKTVENFKRKHTLRGRSALKERKIMKWAVSKRHSFRRPLMWFQCRVWNSCSGEVLLSRIRW